MLVKNYSGKKLNYIYLLRLCETFKSKPHMLCQNCPITYYKTQKKFFKSINFETCLIHQGPYYLKIVIGKIKLNNPKKILRKNKHQNFFKKLF